MTYESNTDCLGRPTPLVDGNNFAVNHYFIDDQRLMCRGNGDATAEALADGVESMQILYGENTDGDPRSANRYVNPFDPAAPNNEDNADLNNVVSVRIALRFQSREAIRANADAKQYALLDSDPFTPADGDRRMRREITTTISLRN